MQGSNGSLVIYKTIVDREWLVLTWRCYFWSPTRSRDKGVFVLIIAMVFIIALWAPNPFMRIFVVQLTDGFPLHIKSC